ncbi:MAG TPA: branched-chain amino acid ABC transporter permease [Firmicutes bacterium]|nr:branched-chain amino acid ABC transporter permease [Bacillota bacterium]
MNASRLLGLLVGLGALAVPLIVTNPFYLHTAIALMINAVLALSLNFILGYVGEKSLGHAAFFGIGGYTAALLALNLHVPSWATLLAAGLVAGLFGLAIGFPTLRLRGPYFAIATLGFGAILQLIATNWTSLTKGPMGIPGVPPLALFGLVFRSERPYYYVALFLLALAAYLTWRLAHSRIGRAFIAIHQNFDLAESVGIDTFRFKLIAFVLGTVLAGTAGAFYAHYTNFISPKALESYITLNVVTMVIIGGEGTLLGPILGAVLVTLLPEVLRVAENYRMVIFGFILLLSIIYAPSGIVGLVRSAWQKRGGEHVA